MKRTTRIAIATIAVAVLSAIALPLSAFALPGSADSAGAASSADSSDARDPRGPHHLRITSPTRTVTGAEGSRLTVVGTSGSGTPISVRLDGHALAGCGRVTPVLRNFDQGGLWDWSCAATIPAPGHHILAAFQSGQPPTGRFLTVFPAGGEPTPTPTPTETPTPTPTPTPTDTPTPTPTPTDTPTPTPTPTETVTPAPTPSQTTPPPPPRKFTPPQWVWRLLLGKLTDLHPGGTFQLTSSGLPEGTRVDVVLHSTPVTIYAGSLGAATTVLTLTVPEDVVLGAHTLIVTATPPTGAAVTKSTPIVVTAVAVELPTHSLDDAGVPRSTVPRSSNDSGSAGASDSRDEPDAPSALTGAIPTFEAIARHPESLAFAGLFAALLLLLVAIPSELLTTVLGANSRRLWPAFARTTKFFDRVRDAVARFTNTGLLASAVLIFGVSFVFGFVDPHFGFDLVSVRMVLSLAIALFLITYGTNWVTRGVLHRYWGAEARITVHPWIALLAVVGVIIARALDFSPGFLIGVVIGLELLRAGRNAQVAGVMVRFGLILALALVGWIGYSIMDAFGEPEGFAPALVRETFVALTAEGLIALLVGALPLKFLEGRELWEKSKPLWGATFLVVAVAFSLLVLPTAAEETTVGDIGLWAIVLVSFAAITLTIWAVFVRIESRERAREQREKRESVDA